MVTSGISKRLVYALCDIGGHAAAPGGFPEDRHARTDFRPVLQFLVAEGIFSLVGDVLDHFLCLVVVADHRIVRCRGKIVQPVEDGREGGIPLGDPPLADRDTGKVRPFEADRDHVGIEHGRARRPHRPALQLMAEDGIVRFGLVEIILADDMQGIVAPDLEECIPGEGGLPFVARPGDSVSLVLPGSEPCLRAFHRHHAERAGHRTGHRRIRTGSREEGGLPTDRSWGNQPVERGWTGEPAGDRARPTGKNPAGGQKIPRKSRTRRLYPAVRS